MILTTTLYDIGVQTLSNIISNLAWFILIIWSVNKIGKNVPDWINQYEKVRNQQRAIDMATRR